MKTMSFKLNFYIQLLFIITIANCEVFNESKVILVNVLLRHGERTPEGFYPTDPYKGNNFYPNGLGGLTNEGKTTVYNLGVFLRNEYGHVLGNDYLPSKIYARSTESPRAQMSAQLALAGMWPPYEAQQWHSHLRWQPIPVNYKLLENEDLLDFRACKFARQFIGIYSQNLTLTAKFLDPYNETFKYIEKHSRMNISDLIDLQRFYFIIVTEKELGLTLPKWTEKVYPDPIYGAVSNIYKYFNSDLRLKQINVGFILQKMINDFANKIKKINDHTAMYLYSAHDTTLGYFLDALITVPPHVPKYGSAILMELHQYEDNYFVKLRYLTSPKDTQPEDLLIPECEVLCPFEKFAEIHSHLLPNLTRREACERNAVT